MARENSLKGDVTKLDFHCLFALQSQELITNSTWMKQTWLGQDSVCHSLDQPAVLEPLQAGVSSCQFPVKP